jgi:hydroxymethylpyrimidine/phosphomethylpyrimidine kinase
VRDLGVSVAVVTGGHTESGTDVLVDGEAEPLRIGGPLHPPGASHGSGCTHSSALAAALARGAGVRDAATAARRITAEAVERGLRDIGAGAGPADVLGLTEPLP